MTDEILLLLLRGLPSLIEGEKVASSLLSIYQPTFFLMLLFFSSSLSLSLSFSLSLSM